MTDRILEIDRDFPQIWRTQKGHGSFLTFDMGHRVKKHDGEMTGSHHLWIYMCDWKLVEQDKELLTSDKIAEEDSLTLDSIFNGESISSIRLNDSSVLINFTNEVRLELQPYSEHAEEDMFIYYRSGKPTISYNPKEGVLMESVQK